MVTSTVYIIHDDMCTCFITLTSRMISVYHVYMLYHLDLQNDLCVPCVHALSLGLPEWSLCTMCTCSITWTSRIISVYHVYMLYHLDFQNDLCVPCAPLVKHVNIVKIHTLVWPKKIFRVNRSFTITGFGWVELGLIVFIMYLFCDVLWKTFNKFSAYFTCVPFKWYGPCWHSWNILDIRADDLIGIVCVVYVKYFQTR